jgi:hypothetical protein
MANLLEGASETIKWHLMVEGAKRGAEAQGYTLDRVPGRGLSNVWVITKSGKSQKASIRTTRDRWIAFPPLENGKKWKTLDEVDVVIVATVDDRDDPKNVEVYIFPAADVRKRFDASYAARVAAGLTMRNNFGMWVALDPKNRNSPADVGTGIVNHYKPVAIIPVADLLAGAQGGVVSDEEVTELASAEEAPAEEIDNDPPLTIPEAKRRLALTLGLKPENIKITVEA